MKHHRFNEMSPKLKDALKEGFKKLGNPVHDFNIKTLLSVVVVL